MPGIWIKLSLQLYKDWMACRNVPHIFCNMQKMTYVLLKYRKHTSLPPSESLPSLIWDLNVLRLPCVFCQKPNALAPLQHCMSGPIQMNASGIMLLLSPPTLTHPQRDICWFKSSLKCPFNHPTIFPIKVSSSLSLQSAALARPLSESSGSVAKPLKANQIFRHLPKLHCQHDSGPSSPHKTTNIHSISDVLAKTSENAFIHTFPTFRFSESWQSINHS